MTELNKKSVRRSFVGKVVGDKMMKTRIVNIERMKEHSKYKKRFVVSKRFKVHDENNEYKIGDTVEIEECRPISREKRWRIVKKIK